MADYNINDLDNVEIPSMEINDLSRVQNDDVIVDNLLNIPLVKGEKGDKGDKGECNTLTIGIVEKGEEAKATIEGDAPNQILNLVLPKGDKGNKGEKGDKRRCRVSRCNL